MDSDLNSYKEGIKMIGLIDCSKLSVKDGCPVAAIRIGGITVLERQVRIMRKIGISQIVIIPPSDKNIIKEITKKLYFKDVNITISPVNRDGLLQSFILHTANNALFLYFDGCTVFDEKIPEKFLSLKKESAAMIPRELLLNDESERCITVEQNSRSYCFAGMATVTLATLMSVNMKNHDMISRNIVERILSNHDSAVLDVSGLSAYNYDMRRHQSFMWMHIESKSDNSAAKKMLLDNAQKSVLDWPAWFIHRPIEKWIVYHICEWPVTPNQITLINILVAFAATYFFAVGSFFPAMILAVVTGIIDGLDGKQARVKIMMSKVGRLEELSDRIYEYSWYLAIAYYLASHGLGNLPYVYFAILLILHVVDIAVSALFKFKKGVQIDDVGQLERNFRWIGSRRNTNIWALIPFVVFGAVYAGYLFLVGYYTLTVVFKVWRTSVHFIRQNNKKTCCG